jgi:RND superfamily putative drug exporter
MSSLLRALAATTTRRPRVSLLVLIPLLIGLIVVGSSAGGEYADDFSVPGIEAQAAQDLIAERFPGQGGDSATVVVTGRVEQRADAIDTALDRIAQQPHVTSVEDLVVSEDGRTGFARVDYDEAATELGADARERLERATAPLDAAGVQVAMSGPVVDAGDAVAVPIGEIAGVVLAIVLLLVVLRSLRAAFASLLTALFGVAAGFTLLGLAAGGIDLPTLAPTMAAMLGIGAGIDYALLNASRHQEELRAGSTPTEAAIRTNQTAGHAAVTAATIVLVSISGLLVTGIPFVGKVGVAAGVMVLVTSLVAVLLLPPLFVAAGRRMLSRKLAAAPTDESVRAGWAVRRPRTALLIGVVIAVALAVPAAWLSIGQPDDGNLAADQTQRQAYDRLAEGFGPGFNGPLVVVVDGADARTAAERLRPAIADTPDVASVSAATTNEQGDSALLTVFPESAPQEQDTAQLVSHLREETIPSALQGTGTDALVGGYTARLVDEADKISARLPIFALTVVGLSLLMLAATFRSLKLAVLSAAFNLVSIAAAYGVIHLLFQTDAGASLIGVEVQPVVAYVPLFMFAILFGLSTDYNVFLLSRVREEWQRLGHVAPAVAVAGARTRRTITAAGAIMIVVFLGFATDPDSTIKMSGLGLASAILIDITLVRLLLAPAALTLLGERIWGSRPHWSSETQPAPAR